MTSASPASQRWLLTLLLLLAGLHAATSALVRPLYQVSDEVNYLAGVQIDALTRGDSVLRPCLSPPDGTPPPASAAPGGKVLFRLSGGFILSTLCRAGFGDTAVIGLRLLSACSLIVVAWCGWHAAVVIVGGTLVPALTALALAAQPVLAKYAGAVSPDSPANACAALAVLCAVQWLVLGPTLARLLGLVLASTAAAAFKDTGLFLVPVNGVVVLNTLARLAWHEPRRRPWLVLTTIVALFTVVGLAQLTRTGYHLDAGVARARNAPLVFISLVVAETVGRLPVLLSSTYSSLGGFGGTAAGLPTTAAATVALIAAASLAGLWQAWRGAAQPRTDVLGYFAVLVAACLVQAPVRQVLLGMTDQHQGRWLFPVAVPLALALGTGLARVGSERGWPLVTVAHLTVLVSALASVAQFHVTSAAWALHKPHLYLHSTGGMDIGVERMFAQVTQAWAATAPPAPATLALLCCLACGALLLRCRPVPGTTHVHHADHR